MHGMSCDAAWWQCSEWQGFTPLLLKLSQLHCKQPGKRAYTPASTGYQLSAISYQLWAMSYQLWAMSYQLAASTAAQQETVTHCLMHR